MINTINEAINRKLNSISFTTIIKGTVESLEPLKVRISNKISIGLSFIEPRSLGIDDSSPSPALPLVVGEEIEMVRYNNGQRFYVLGKAASGGTVNYNDLQNKPILNTNNTASQSVKSDEVMGGTIKLHKISKTGSYNDLRDKPTKVSEFTNDAGYLTEHQDISNLATKDELHFHNNKSVLDSITQENIDNWNNSIGEVLPIGTMLPYTSKVIPNGFLPCDGSEVSRTEYKDLFAIIGTSYGAGDGSTTFNLPNKKGRVSVGLDFSQTEFNTIGKKGGEKTHQLTIEEMPRHNHKQTLADNGSMSGKAAYDWTMSNTSRDYDGSDLAQYTGEDKPHNNLQPYEVDQWIIKAFNGAYNQPISGDVNDTLPVGSIIKFDGDYIPEGYEEVEDNEHTYSTKESIIGTWIDGKPLYRKVLTGTLPNIGEVKFSIQNAKIIDYEGLIQSKWGYWYKINDHFPREQGYEIYSGLNAERNELSIFCGSFYTTNSQYEITLEYTKTTD